MSRLSFLTVQSIIQWANGNALINDVMFLGGSRSLPYIKARNVFYYFKHTGSSYELIMTSQHDLESYRR